MRLAFRGDTAAFELWLSSDAPLELGRNTPELDARDNSRISRCQLKLRLSDGKVMLESCGANPTGIRRSGLALWEWVDKGETRPLGLGDSVALSYLSGGHGDNRTPSTVLSCSAAVVATTAVLAPAHPARPCTASAADPTANSRLLEAMLAEEPCRTSSHETGVGLPKKSLASIMDDDNDEPWRGEARASGSSFSGSLPGAAGSSAAAASSFAATAPARSDLPEEQHECEICYDTVPVAATLALCKAGHRFCAECAWRCCESSFGDGLVPACPKAKDARCGTVSRKVASAALTRWLTDPEADTQSRKVALASWDISSAAGGRFESGKLEGIYESAERARQGAVQCIGKGGKGCEAWYVPPRPHAQEPQRLLCVAAGCGATFCSACRQPFHFRSTCAEALRLSARWVRFLQDELSPFLMAAVRVDGERWAPVLQMHAGSKGALDEATREALSRFDELRQMELWKQKHCRRCPYCTRVVEKIDGCDMLICGGNYHGGNQQRGCGKQFIWGDGQPNSSLPYEADLRGAADYAADGADGADGAGGGGGGGADEDGPMRERRLRRDAREEHQQRAGVSVRHQP